MTALIFTTLLSLPLYPLNPTGQDTVSFINVHVTAGLNGPGAVVSTGPELTVKYEMTLVYPLILRTAFDYRYGSISSSVYPNGDIHRGLFSAEALYYRGANGLTGYVGFGLVWAINSFSISSSDMDSLFTNHGITSVDMENVPGYRLTAGLRIHKTYSIEIGLTETRPSYVYTTRHSSTSYSVFKKQFRSNDFRVSVGYLFTLKL